MSTNFSNLKDGIEIFHPCLIPEIKRWISLLNNTRKCHSPHQRNEMNSNLISHRGSDVFSKGFEETGDN